MELTGTRRMFTFQMTKTLSLPTTLALVRRLPDIGNPASTSSWNEQPDTTQEN